MNCMLSTADKDTITLRYRGITLRIPCDERYLGPSENELRRMRLEEEGRVKLIKWVKSWEGEK